MKQAAAIHVRISRSRSVSCTSCVAWISTRGPRRRAYSGGMRRRLDIARSLVGDPSVIVLDEPTTGPTVRPLRHLLDERGWTGWTRVERRTD